MGNVLVTFSASWADEFDAEGFAIYTPTQVEALKTVLLSSSPEWYFGTNEGFEEGALTKDDFTFQELTEEEEATVRKLFPNLKYGFGQIMDYEYVEEAILNTTE